MTDITPTTASAASQAPALAPEPSPALPPPPSRATFDVLPLSREVRETLAEIGYTHPTPVQIAVWEPATRGKDAVVQARTGTGKTAAFGLPIVDHLVRRSAPQVQVLALCPTRELALQVATEIERLGKRRNVKVTAIYGGAPMQRQIDQIADGAQVIVGTPGRVLDHLRRGTLDPRHIRMLVLDEADEMLSMGFEREVTAILDTLPKDRQTLLFSATVPPDIERMAKKLRSPEFLTLSGDHVGALEIEHFVYMVASDKLAALVRIIEVENPEGAVIFCNTKDETERVAQTLVRHGYDADWLNGDLPQSDREKVMSATREGRLRFLVATDVAARGIDISHLTHVINYDFPQDAESYVHRTGRTGRAGRTGTAIALITPHDVGGLYLLRLTYKIRPIERQIPTEGELKTRAEADLVTMLVEAFGGPSQTGVHPDDLALARRLLTHEQCDVIFAGLLRDHLGARPTAKQEAATARRATRVAPPPPPPPPPAPRMALPARSPMGATPPAPAPTTVAAPHNPAPTMVAAPHNPVPAMVAAPPTAAPTMVAATPNPAPTMVAAPPNPAPISHAGSAPAPLPYAAPRPDRRPDERRGRDDRRDRSDDRRPPPAPTGLLPRRPRREDHTPVSAAQGSHEGHADPRHPPQRHADFSTWQPPEEEGDDEPILGADEAFGPDLHAGHHGERPRAFPDNHRGDRPHRSPYQPAVLTPQTAPVPLPVTMAEGEGDEDFSEIYVNVGRRDGARAADYQRILTERAGLDRAHVRRIRVRERNAFVSVRRDDLARALAALNGATLAGKQAMAEQARERGSSEGEGPDAAATHGEAGLPELGHEAAPAPPVSDEGFAGDPSIPAAETSSEDAVPTGRSQS